MMRSFTNRSRAASTSSNKSDDQCVYTTVYKTVSKFLNDSSGEPQRITISNEQKRNTNVVSICIDELSKKEAIDMVDSRHFEAAFDAANNRKSVRKGCEQAKSFFKEHVIQRNPFPPRRHFPLNAKRYFELKEMQKKQRILHKTNDTVPYSANTLSSSVSSTSFSSLAPSKSTISSHRSWSTASNISEKRDITPILPDLLIHSRVRPPNSRRPTRFTSSEEARMINTYNTPE